MDKNLVMITRIRRHIILSIFFAVICLFAFSYHLNAQSFSEGRFGFFDNWRININAGSNLFYGDIQQYQYAPYKDDWRMAYGLVLRKQISPVFGLGFQILNGTLHGTRKNYAGGDKVFDSKIFEYNLNATIDFNSLFAGYNPDRRFSIYGLAGLGFSNWKTTLKNNGKVIRTTGYTGKGPGKRTTELVLPLGLGIKYDVSDNIGLNLESSLRGVNSDILDAWESHFKYDFYNYTSLGLFYNFNSINVRPDLARQQARYNRRMARQSEKEMKMYERRMDAERQQDRYRQEYKEAIDYRERQKRYKRAEKDIDYFHEQTRKQDDRPTQRDYYDYQRQQQEAIQSFWEKHERGELPEVTEYDKHGVYKRLASDEQKQKEDYPGELEILEIEPDEIPEDKKSRVLTDNSGTYTEQPSQKRVQSVQNVVFRVQILAKTTGPANTDKIAEKYGVIKTINEDKQNGIYRYVVGRFSNYDDALKYARKLKDKGITDAFVVAYKNRTRIPLSSVVNK